jgi:hypothetical protein
MNAEPPRKACFEVKVNRKAVLSLLHMPRPFQEVGYKPGLPFNLTRSILFLSHSELSFRLGSLTLKKLRLILLLQCSSFLASPDTFKAVHASWALNTESCER